MSLSDASPQLAYLYKQKMLKFESFDNSGAIEQLDSLRPVPEFNRTGEFLTGQERRDE